MSQRRSQRGGEGGKGGGSQASTSADDEVWVGLNDLILVNGPGAAQYGRYFLQAASRRLYTQYAEYQRAMVLKNKGDPA